MEEKRIERLGVCMKTFAEVDRQVLPIVGKCLDGMTKAAESIEPKTVSPHRRYRSTRAQARATMWGYITYSTWLSRSAIFFSFRGFWHLKSRT